MKDRLYLLRPGFMDQGKGPFFCPECALLEGMLSYYPDLRNRIEIHYVDFPRPRAVLISELGPEGQGCPTLILGDVTRPAPPGLTVREVNGRRFIAKDIEICRYLASAYGVGQPH